MAIDFSLVFSRLRQLADAVDRRFDTVEGQVATKLNETQVRNIAEETAGTNFTGGDGIALVGSDIRINIDELPLG